MTNRVLTALVAGCGCLAFAAIMSGCLGYRVKGSIPGNVRSIDIPTFVNKCGQPGIESIATAETIREFQKERSVRIQGGASSDAVLEVEIVGYELKPLRYSKDNAIEAKEYRLTLTASVVLRRAKPGGEILAKDPRVIGYTTFVLSGDPAVAKDAALPAAAQSLAHNVLQSLLEAW